MRNYGLALVALVLVGLVGCHSVTTRIVDVSPAKTTEREIPDDLRLEIGIIVFDANVPHYFDDIEKANITPELRQAEANYIAGYLKDYLQRTANWGAVRVLPGESSLVDVMVSGKIIHSDGERQILNVKVADQSGNVWLEETYETLASKYAYDSEVPEHIDPFQTTYRTIANSMLEYMEQLSFEDITELKTITKMLHAQSVNPLAFDGYLAVTEDGRIELARLPSESDPRMDSVNDLRQFEYLFIDTLDEYYLEFAMQMQEPYTQWREQTYDLAIALREDRNKAKVRLLAGITMVLAGAVGQRSSETAAEYAGYAGVIGGSTEILGSIASRQNIKLYKGQLQELGQGAAEEINPYTLELENRTYSLQGTTQEQLEQLQEILKKEYYQDLGIPEPVEDSETEPEAAAPAGEESTGEFFQGDE